MGKLCLGLNHLGYRQSLARNTTESEVIAFVYMLSWGGLPVGEQSHNCLETAKGSDLK
jgi:hypothetical protein